MAVANESAADRFDRDWKHTEADYKARTLDAQPEDRKYRLYVDEDGVSAVEVDDEA